MASSANLTLSWPRLHTSPMQQLQNWSVCQICGSVAERGTDEWLDSPHRSHVGIRVVRCPRHWSEWALRNCEAGRTNENRNRLYMLKLKYKNAPPPFPTTVPVSDGLEA